MYQQQQPKTNSMLTPLPDADWAYTVLADLKRCVREYGTAATESSCPDVRKMFTSLMSSTLQMQGELYTAMQQAKMYDTSSPVLRQEIQKQIATYQQTQQQTQGFIQQRMGGQQSVQPHMQPQAMQPISQQPYIGAQQSYAPQQQQYIQPQMPRHVPAPQQQHFYN